MTREQEQIQSMRRHIADLEARLLAIEARVGVTDHLVSVGETSVQCPDCAERIGSVIYQHETHEQAARRARLHERLREHREAHRVPS